MTKTNQPKDNPAQTAQAADEAGALGDLRSYLRWLGDSGRLIAERDPAQAMPSADVPTAVQGSGVGAEKTPSVITSKPIATAAPGPAPRSGTAETVEQALARIAAEAQACCACPLGHSRTQAVPGVGNPHARLMFVGEAPGAKEDQSGVPFVGPAGQLLTLALTQAGLSREDVFIANVLKCRPPNNRDPEPTEIESCRPFLHQQIDAVNPPYLAALGRIAAGMLLGRPVSIMRERGTWAEYRGRPLFLSLHPSAVLHNPNNRSLFLEDIATLVRTVQSDQKTE